MNAAEYFDFVSRLAIRGTELTLTGIAIGFILIAALSSFWRFARRTRAATRYVGWALLLPVVLALPLLLQLGSNQAASYEVTESTAMGANKSEF